MDKAQIYAFLDENNIKYEAIEHEAVYNMQELEKISLPESFSKWDAKNLFIRDDKKKNYYLISVMGDKRVDLKEFRKKHALRALSFASAGELQDILGLIPGAVTPLGLLNDDERKVAFFLDSAFEGGSIAIHPNDNTASVLMRTDDLMHLIEEHGNSAEFTEI